MSGNYPKIARIDWFRVIVDLEGKRWSLERIATAVDRSKGWVSNLKNIPGTEPRFHDGLLLLGLWVQVTGKDHPLAPITTTAAKGQEPSRAGADTRGVSSSQPAQEPSNGQERPASPDSRSATRGLAAAGSDRPVPA